MKRDIVKEGSVLEPNIAKAADNKSQDLNKPEDDIVSDQHGSL